MFLFISAGVGRTGVFIALTNLIERLKTEAVIDVYQTVKKLRQQRTAMVQTKVGLFNVLPLNILRGLEVVEVLHRKVLQRDCSHRGEG